MPPHEALPPTHKLEGQGYSAGHHWSWTHWIWLTTGMMTRPHDATARLWGLPEPAPSRVFQQASRRAAASGWTGPSDTGSRSRLQSRMAMIASAAWAEGLCLPPRPGILSLGPIHRMCPPRLSGRSNATQGPGVRNPAWAPAAHCSSITATQGRI